MPRRLAPLLAFVLIVLAAAPGAAAAGARSDPAAARRAVIAYWTPERMARALPRQTVEEPDGVRRYLRPDELGARIAARPAPKPSPSCGTSDGLDWTCGGLAQRATGKVFFTIRNTGYACSGSVIGDSSSSRSIVLTAGHCAYDQDSGFVTNWLFVPEWDATPGVSTCSATKWGCWVAERLVVHAGWSSESGLTSAAMRHDWGFAVVGAGDFAPTSQLDAAVGSFGLAYPGLTSGAGAYAFGYPAEKGYTGNSLIYCAGSVDTDPYTGVTWRLAPCKLSGGSSGGPWFASFDVASGVGAVASVNSYTRRTISAIHGPVFDSKTQATYNAANASGSGDQIVG